MKNLVHGIAVHWFFALFLLLTACHEDDLPDYAGCRLHFVNANYECVHYCGSSLEYRYGESGKVSETIYSPGGPNGWIINHTTYVFDGDTLRSARSDNGIEVIDTHYTYQGGQLATMERVDNNSYDSSMTTSKVVFDHDAEGRITHKTEYHGSTIVAEDWYVYENGKPYHWQSSSGGLTNDLYFEYDDKVNPEALTGIYIEDPIRSFPHNILSKLEIHDGSNNPGEPARYHYKYDASGLPIESTGYIYSYDCD